MRWHVMDPEEATIYRRRDGGAEWELTRDEAMRLSEAAIVVSLDERNFNESLNVYWQRKLFKQLHYDERLGWTS